MAAKNDAQPTFENASLCIMMPAVVASFNKIEHRLHRFEQYQIPVITVETKDKLIKNPFGTSNYRVNPRPRISFQTNIDFPPSAFKHVAVPTVSSSVQTQEVEMVDNPQTLTMAIKPAACSVTETKSDKQVKYPVQS